MNRSFLVAGSILLAAALTPVAAQADSPREFLQNALMGDNSEIMLGNLAAERGRTLVRDHSQARNEVLDVGRRFGLRPTREVKPEAREMRDRLIALRGRAFDREFISHMVEDHRNDIGEFRDEAREHHGPVSDLAARQLPVLREHLRTARALDRGEGRFWGRNDQINDQMHDWRDRDRRDDDRDDLNERDRYRR